MKSFMEEFKKFINRGNVMNLAVGVIIGGAFQAIINSLVKDVIMPVLSLITGGVDFSEWKIVLREVAEGETAPTLNYGNLINAIINFVLMALVIFMLVRAVNKAQEKAKKEEEAAAPAAPTTKTCPYCKSEIAIDATRCPHCTSELKAE